MYHAATDRSAFASGERWPVDVLQTRYDEPHPAWWPIRRPANERVILPTLAESTAFRTALEAGYRRTLNRAEQPVRVTPQESVLWTRRYLRYRLNGCPHQDAVEKVFRQLRDGVVARLCASSGPVMFPPRDETVEFRRQLEANPPSSRGAVSFVDAEGDAVWLEEYLQRRLSGCTHEVATAAVMAQLEGRAPTPCETNTP